MMRRGKFVEMRGLAAQAAGLQRVELAVTGTPASELSDLIHQVFSVAKEWTSSSSVPQSAPPAPAQPTAAADVDGLFSDDDLSKAIAEAGLDELFASDPGVQAVKTEVSDSADSGAPGWIKLDRGIPSYIDQESGTRRYKCPICLVNPSSSRDTIEGHYCRVHLLRGGQCIFLGKDEEGKDAMCNKVAFCKSNMIKHMQRAHGLKKGTVFSNYWVQVTLEAGH
jgi:hypothetical protein